jgi:hypothetical protein
MGEDMMVEVKVVEREREGVVLTRHWTGDELVGARGACEIGVFNRSHHICVSGLQLFGMTYSVEEKSEEESRNWMKYV